jgi:hypothetical protein
MALRRRTRTRDSAAEALDRAVALLQGYQRAGAAEVPVADVLAMLGAAPEAEAVTGPMPVVSGADPLTGCLPVTPG